MRPYGGAKFFRDWVRFGFLNVKMHNFPLFYLFWVISKKNCWLLSHFFFFKSSSGHLGQKSHLEKSKKTAIHFHLWISNLPPTPYTLWPKLINFTLRNFFYQNLLSPPPLSPYPLWSRLIIFLLISIYYFFIYFIMARFRTNTT